MLALTNSMVKYLLNPILLAGPLLCVFTKCCPPIDVAQC